MVNFMTAEILLQEAELADLPALLQVIQVAYAEFLGKLDPPSGAFQETLASLTKKLALGGAIKAVITGELTEEIVGCVFYELGQGELYLGRLAVLPSYRRRGIAQQLIATVEERARQHDRPRVIMGVRLVLPEHLNYYAKLGYSVYRYANHPGYSQPTSAELEKIVDRGLQRYVEVVAHDPHWREQFEIEAARLRPLFGPELIALHHIGSTAIQGIYAKPIIDMLPEVRDITRVDGLNLALAELGYAAKGEHGIPGRRFFRKGLFHQAGEQRTHHLHTFQTGNPEIARHVDFCAYLNAHPAAAQQYGTLKQELASRFATNILRYNEGKTALIRQLDEQAKAWRKR
jgi:GrpB-like predicted nucleotidyltransferase (UPF0157 family)/ribosomal protein S18 acetylase RimI-like enzyme